MAGVPNVVNCWRTTLAFNCGTPPQLAEIVLHVKALTASNPQDVANDVGAAWIATNSFITSMASTTKGSNITVQNYDGVSAPVICTVTGFTNVAMTGTTPAVPANVAYVVTKRTGLAGRSNRGRMYIPSIPQTFLDIGSTQWLSSSLNTLNTNSTAFLGKLRTGVATQDLYVYSHKNNTVQLVTSLVPRQYLGTIRSRTTLHSP